MAGLAGIGAIVTGAAAGNRDTRRHVRRAYDGDVPNGSASRSSREIILDSAQELVSTLGYDGMVISELTARSGLPASSIYYYFGSKLGVLAALLDRAAEQFHASFPSPVAFDDLPPFERFERWFSAACTSLDSRPEYLRMLLAVVVGSPLEDDEVRSTVERIRAQAHATWVDVLTPVFRRDGSPEEDRLVEQLAVIGRALTDGLSVRLTVDGASYTSHVATFVAMVRALASARSRPASH